jgi:DNA-binding CsgD family transcriptional regulator
MRKRKRRVNVLTERQHHVLKRIAMGKTADAIAVELGVTAPTIKDHIKRIFAKLGAVDRAHAVALAMRKGVLR